SVRGSPSVSDRCRRHRRVRACYSCRAAPGANFGRRASVGHIACREAVVCVVAPRRGAARCRIGPRIERTAPTCKLLSSSIAITYSTSSTIVSREARRLSMAGSPLIVLLAAALLIYWFRYACRLVLNARTEPDCVARVSAANGLSFLLVRSKLQRGEGRLD